MEMKYSIFMWGNFKVNLVVVDCGFVNVNLGGF